jgi:hypothetical protein
MAYGQKQARSSGGRRIFSALMFTAAAWGSWAGCSPETPTEIVAGVSTQLQVPKYLKTVGVVVRLGGRLIFCESYAVHDGTVTLPSTIGAAPPSDADSAPTDPVTVQVLGFQDDQPNFSTDCVVSPNGEDDQVLVLRRRRLPYVDGRIVYLPMKLKESCLNVQCGDDQTCIGGVCEDAAIDPAILPDYRDSLIFGNTNTCFSVERCLPEPRLPVALENLDDCTFRVLLPEGVPAPEPGNLNVQIIYRTLGTEVLDLDDKEGFILHDPDDSLTFRLAPNLCESNFKAGKIIAVSAAAFCPPKLEFQPICTADLKEIQAGINIFNQGFEGQCVTDAPLKQTESALYVLLDSSKAMGEFYGPDGLQFALETTLKNPIAARTQIGFSPLPDPGCSANFAMPLIAFSDVSAVRQPIAAFVGDTSNVRNDDPILGLDNAMTGAYSALAALTPSESAQFNRRALVVIGNRDLLQSCGAEPATLAANALSDPNNSIHTYVVALEAPAGTTQLGDPATDGGAIATAGGTVLSNAIADPSEGPLAVQKIVNDLGSCVYDQPIANMAPVPVPDNATLTYMSPDPNALVRADVAHNTQCTESTANTGSGWNNDGNRVRICGSDCQDLRKALTDLATGYAFLGQPAPAIPMSVSLPCAVVTP